MKRVTILLPLVLLGLALLGGGTAATHKPLAGDLDRSFARGGVATRDIQGVADGLALQPDGKIVVVGGGPPAGQRGFLLARYLPDGSLDPGFGKGGKVETPFSKYWGFAAKVAVQPDGKIVVAGISYQGSDQFLGEFTVARYKPNGSLDPSFGGDGVTTTPIEGRPDWWTSANAYALAVLRDGKILAAGTTDESDGGEFDFSEFTLVRYRADGSLDPTFGKSGVVVTSFLGADRLGGIAVEPDGKIVAAGTAVGGGKEYHPAIAVARYRDNGSLDPSFGVGGKVTTGHDRLSDGNAVALLRDGKILVSGVDAVKGGTVLIRYRPSGALDRHFGRAGVRWITRTTFDPGVSAIAVQPDRRILLGKPGRLIRIRPDGVQDPSFGRRGLVITKVGVTSLALQPDGRIVLAGGNKAGSFVVSRYLGGSNCVVPDVRAKRVARAKSVLRQAYCKAGRVQARFSATVAAGRVISQAPAHGRRLPGGTKVSLVVSKGPRR